MRYHLYFLFFSDIACKKESTFTVTVEDGDEFKFKTHKKGKKYKKANCLVEYKLGDSCKKIEFECSKFSLHGPKKCNKKCHNKCKDMITIDGSQICGTQKENTFSFDDNFNVTFVADKKGHKKGVKCYVRCTEAATTTATTGTTTDTTSRGTTSSTGTTTSTTSTSATSTTTTASPSTTG